MGNFDAISLVAESDKGADVEAVEPGLDRRYYFVDLLVDEADAEGTEWRRVLLAELGDVNFDIFLEDVFQYELFDEGDDLLA
jgi:hypothetical protein